MFYKRFLFRFRFPCKHILKAWTGKGCDLDETYRLPNLAELETDSSRENFRTENTTPPFELRVGWNNSGFAFSLLVFNKKQRPWCRAIHPEESDGIQICLDTRDVKDIHRATRFCHRLIFLPTGNGHSQTAPGVFWLPIHRAKDHPNPIDLEKIKLHNSIGVNGYRLDVWIPSEVLTGYDPKEHPNLGFHFALIDRELGNRFFLIEPPFPHDQDPSLWATLELNSEKNF
ncbi:MAG: hypothetical protein LBQ50_06675 [Planctomycetaceae bacterium]|jgi:hypothetical protein|nr:hypothetical protein [Planctomycetaceae bacterium]